MEMQRTTPSRKWSSRFADVEMKEVAVMKVKVEELMMERKESCMMPTKSDAS